MAGRVEAQEIKVGGLFDLTGITSDVGKPYAQGVQDGVAFVNANGGINGKKVKLISRGLRVQDPGGGLAPTSGSSPTSRSS